MKRDEILKEADKEGVRFIRLQFTDIIGVLKNVEISRSQLEKALDGEIMFDGSSIKGFLRIEESDMLLVPDYSTWRINPWKNPDGSKGARLICDIYKPDKTPFEGCPRQTLKRQVEEAKKLGFKMVAGPEAEFFLLPLDAKRDPIVELHDVGGYFDLTPVDRGEECRRDIVMVLEEMGFEVEAAHHEVAPGQHEIDFKYAEAVECADNLSTFKFVVKKVALEHNLHATFMPKPFFGVNGSGMHTHQSLFTLNNENAFFDPNGTYQLSKVAFSYIAGILEHASAFVAVTNPTVNSYKRLVPHYEAPTNIAWGLHNRSPLVRIPAKRGRSTRCEVRVPDPSSNPYLALTVMLAAGIDGVKKNLIPPSPVERNIFSMTQEEKEKFGIKSLPTNLGSAIDNLKKDNVIKEALGEHIFSNFVAAKEMEWLEYITQVHKWEIDRYLTTF